MQASEPKGGQHVRNKVVAYCIQSTSTRNKTWIKREPRIPPPTPTNYPIILVSSQSRSSRSSRPKLVHAYSIKAHVSTSSSNQSYSPSTSSPPSYFTSCSSLGTMRLNATINSLGSSCRRSTLCREIVNKMAAICSKSSSKRLAASRAVSTRLHVVMLWPVSWTTRMRRHSISVDTLK